MRILVLGTSNSILKGGYVDGLRAALPDAEIVNRSIGGSTGLQFASACTEDLTIYDVALFDSVVNDENQLPYVGSASYFQTILFEIMSTIASQTRLFVIGFCNLKHYHKKSAPFHIHEICAAESRAVFCDAREFFAQHPSRTPEYADGAHLALAPAFAFGNYLARKIVSTPKPSGLPKSYAHKFASYDATALTASTYTKKNRLGEWRFGLLEGVDSRLNLSSSAKSGDILIGLLIDRTQTDCTLRVSSQIYLHRDFSMRYDIGVQSSWVQFVPFKDGARGDEIRLVDGVGEPAPLEAASGAPVAHRAAISKIVCRKGA